jgi:hypothetical protein
MAGKLKKRDLLDRETVEMLVGFCAIVLFGFSRVLIQQG